MQYTKILLLGILYSISSWNIYAQETIPLQGKVTSSTGHPIPGVLIKIHPLNKGILTDEQGKYTFPGIAGQSYALTFNFLGFHPQQRSILLTAEDRELNVVLQESTQELGSVTVTGKSENRLIQEKAYNVDVVDAKKLHHTSLDIGHALDRVSGIRIRESGGVGSRMSFSLNGFTGKQVKFFIDGIPMDDFGSSFQLNNIPINIAERIEIYKGVVPVGLGADALGGAVNIVTNAIQKNYLDVSYSYGSFNTHRTAVNAAFVSPSGLTAQFNLFQNYSDNNYWIDVDVADINTGQYYPNQRVRRFHDNYHNETFITQVGMQNKPYADKLLLGITLGQNYAEIQTGARLVSVFGDWHRRGNIIMPTFKYAKKDLLTKGLDLAINANYNLGTEQNIDTVNRRYNWFRQYKEYETPGGERSYSLYKYKNNNAVATANVNWQWAERHQLTLSNVVNSFDRQGRDALFPNQDNYEQPRKSLKNIAGLGYQFQKDERFSTSAFIKHYTQINRFALAYNPSGEYGDIAYRNEKASFQYLGYGWTGAYFIHDNLQVKASFEKSYRLPEPEELFGDMVNLQGNNELEPEKSFNYNLGLSYWKSFSSDHRMEISGNAFYRDSKDFIRPRLNNNQAMQVMENLFNVTNLGGEGEFRYHFKDHFTAGFNASYQDLRNNTRFVEGQTVESVVYRDRIPNMPYLFGNADAAYTFRDLVKNGNDLSLGYNLLYVHEFYLYWPSLGSDKLHVPQQLSHDLNMTYTLGGKNKFQFTLECRNLLDKPLYDNFSLQKPGRGFTGKIRYLIL